MTRINLFLKLSLVHVKKYHIWSKYEKNKRIQIKCIKHSLKIYLENIYKTLSEANSTSSSQKGQIWINMTRKYKESNKIATKCEKMFLYFRATELLSKALKPCSLELVKIASKTAYKL